MELISIIIPTYNRQDYIKEAVESVLVQDYPSLELIVVDDGSKDNTKQVLMPYLGKIKYIKQENSGPAKARNSGIKASQGRYISFLDSDDIYLPEKVKRQAEYLEAHPECGMVYCDYGYFDDSGRHWASFHESFSGRIFEKLLFADFIGSSSTVMAKKEILEEIGMFNEALITGEDRNLYLKIAGRYPIGFIGRMLVHIREHPQRISYNYEVPLGTVEGIKDALKMYPEYDPKKSRVARSALALRALRLSDELFYAGKYTPARKYYLEAIRYNPTHLLAFRFLCYLIFPKAVIEALKRLKAGQRR